MKPTPLQNRRWQYKHKFGMTIDDYETLLAEQDGKCFICARIELHMERAFK